MKRVALPLALAVSLGIVACGTVGSLASPTPVATVVEATPTATFTDMSKAAITELFVRQSASIKEGDWQSAFHSCTPSYRTRRDVPRFQEDVERYLLRHDTTAATLDVRNPQVTKGRDDRFDMNYDLYIDSEFAETIRVGGAYVQVQDEWYDDGVWCR